ncbi:MAG: hypothetical protein NTV52_01770 [Acidobacteria bacterium]|nr:hypothetical protein [Acidobacteriota bacterium]
MDGVDRPAPTMVYLRVGVDPLTRPGRPPSVPRGATFAIRSERASTQGFLQEVTAAVKAVNPDLPLAKVRTLSEVYRLSTARTSFALVLLGIAGSMALILAIIGLYGVLAYAVAQRKQEISIRLALGAAPDSIQSLFVRQGLALAGIGGIIGLASSSALSRGLASLLYAGPTHLRRRHRQLSSSTPSRVCRSDGQPSQRLNPSPPATRSAGLPLDGRAKEEGRELVPAARV